MRITITEPCVVEADGPILVSPIPAPKVEDFMAGIQKPAEVPHETEAEYRTRVNGHDYPKNRRTRRRHQVGPCLFCGEMFRGQANQLYCSDIHKHRYYTKNPNPTGRRRKHGIVPPEQGLAINAGSRGVDVKVVDRQ